MEIKVKRIFTIKIPYFFNKYFELTLYNSIGKERHILRLSIWRLRKLIDIPGYEDEWGGLPLKHITIFNKKRGNVMSKLENWAIVCSLDDPYMAPELMNYSLRGNIYNDEKKRFVDGDPVRTSHIREFNLEENYAQTKL